MQRQKSRTLATYANIFGMFGIFCCHFLCTVAAQVGNEKLYVTCCYVWDLLSASTIEYTGSSIQCKEYDCKDLHLVRRFVEQTNVMLGVTSTDMPSPVTFEGNLLFVDMALITTEQLLEMMTLAFVGRYITVDDLALDHKINLVYDNQNPEKLKVERPACEYSKHIYNAMVLASVVLLIFFITMQMIEKQGKKDNAVTPYTAADQADDKSDDKPNELDIDGKPVQTIVAAGLMRPMPDFRHIRLRM